HPARHVVMTRLLGETPLKGRWGYSLRAHRARCASALRSAPAKARSRRGLTAAGRRTRSPASSPRVLPRAFAPRGLAAFASRRLAVLGLPHSRSRAPLRSARVVTAGLWQSLHAMHEQ